MSLGQQLHLPPAYEKRDVRIKDGRKRKKK
jgi:hypothetical protein